MPCSNWSTAIVSPYCNNSQSFQSHQMQGKTFLAWILGFAVDVEGWPGSHGWCYRRIYFSSPVMILCRKFFFQNIENKVSTMSCRRFCLRTVHSEPIFFPAEHFSLTSCSVSSFSVWVEFIYINDCNSTVSTFWGRPARGSSSIHLLTFLVPYFTRRTTYNILSIYSTNRFRDFSCIFRENRICSFVIDDFWGYVHPTPNCMVFYKAKFQRFKTTK